MASRKDDLIDAREAARDEAARAFDSSVKRVQGLQQGAAATTAEAEDRVAAIKEAGSTSFLSELGGTRSLITGIGALGALLAGEGDIAGGIAVGGLLGTSQRADQINKLRTESADKATADVLASRAQETQLSIAELGATGAPSSQEVGFVMSETSQLIGRDIQLEIMAKQDIYARLSQTDSQRATSMLTKDKAGYSLELMRATLNEQEKKELNRVMLESGKTLEEIAAAGGLEEVKLGLTEEYYVSKRQIDVEYTKAEEVRAVANTKEVDKFRSDLELSSDKELLDITQSFTSNLTEDAQEHEVRVEILRSNLAISRLEKSSDLETQQRILAMKEKYGGDTLAEAVANGGGWANVDQTLAKEYESFRKKNNIVLDALAEGRASIFTDDITKEILGKTNVELADWERRAKSRLMKDSMLIEAFGVALASGDIGEAWRVGVSLGFDADDPEVAQLIASTSALASAGRIDEAMAELMPHLLNRATSISQQAYQAALANGEDPFEAAKKLNMLENTREEDVRLRNERKVVLARIVGDWRDATPEEKRDPAVFIATHAGDDIDLLAETGGIDELNRLFSANDVNALELRYNAALQEVMSRQDYPDMTSDEVHRTATDLMLAKETQASQRYHRNQILPSISAEIDSFKSRLEDAGVNRSDTLRAIEMMEDLAHSLPSETLRSVEATTVAMQEVEGRILSAIENNDPGLFKAAFGKFMLSVVGTAANEVGGATGGVSLNPVDAFNQWKNLGEFLFGKNSMKDLKKQLDQEGN